MPDTALVAAFAGISGVIIGSTSTYLVAQKNLKKEISLKMAEYRLQWINKLGDEFADFSAHSFRTFLETDGSKQRELVYGLMKSFMKVQMLMNVKDRDYKELTEKMEEILEYSGEERKNGLKQVDIGKFHSKNDNFARIANAILKREWTKTKQHLRIDTVKVSALGSESDLGYIDRIVKEANNRTAG